MTPAARIAAAAEVLDEIRGGVAAEPALTRWGRGHRFAGSKDRAAIRDHVFDALRCRASFAAWGGGETGRALMLGMLRAEGRDPATVFNGEGHAPEPLSEAETAAGGAPEGMAALDCPAWVSGALRASLGDDFESVMRVLQRRADVFLRANVLRASREEAAQALADEGIVAEPGPLAPECLKVVEGARRIKLSQAYLDGLVELQDAASQAVCAHIPLPETGKVLDYCAGGGGKVLALAARSPGLSYAAHDAFPKRMKDLPARAERAGVDARLVSESDVETVAYDVILTDVPCSGSGAWRRQPEAKWALDQATLDGLLTVQQEILDTAARLVAPRGTLAYATCSMLNAENGDQISAFLARNSAFEMVSERRFSPLEGGDGFFLALLRRCGEA